MNLLKTHHILGKTLTETKQGHPHYAAALSMIQQHRHPNEHSCFFFYFEAAVRHAKCNLHNVQKRSHIKCKRGQNRYVSLMGKKSWLQVLKLQPPEVRLELFIPAKQVKPASECSPRIAYVFYKYILLRYVHHSSTHLLKHKHLIKVCNETPYPYELYWS